DRSARRPRGPRRIRAGRRAAPRALFPAGGNPVSLRGRARPRPACGGRRRRAVDRRTACRAAPCRAPGRARPRFRRARSAGGARDRGGGGCSRQAPRPLAELRPAAAPRRPARRRAAQAAGSDAAQTGTWPAPRHPRARRAGANDRRAHRGSARRGRRSGAADAAARRSAADLRGGDAPHRAGRVRAQAAGGGLARAGRARPVCRGRGNPGGADL
ncbi:MAG: ABC transporter involved in cytochrome c biogenesis, CcmB subunit, partial [uncultured Sphingomonadaceae bacterium]